MSEPTVAWPPTHEQRALIAQLAVLDRLDALEEIEREHANNDT